MSPDASGAGPPMRWKLFLPLFMASAVGACRDGSDAPEGVRGGHVTDSAGVRVVENSGGDRTLAWRLEEVLRIGPEDEGPGAFFRVDARGIATDGEGRLYVLDQGAVQVKAFDGDGRLIRTLGGEGDGPGELRNPVSLFVSPRGEVSVLDAGKNAFVRFGPNGRTLDQIRLPPVRRAAHPTPVRDGGVVMGQDTILSPTGELRPGVPYRTRLLLFTPTADGGWSDPVELVSADAERPSTFTPVGAPDCPMKIALPPVFTREPIWAVDRERALTNGWHAYRVDVTGLDGARTSVRRQLPVMEGSRERAAAEIGPIQSDRFGGSCNQTAEARADQAGWAGMIPWVKEIRSGPGGGLFVLRRAPGAEPSERIDVFDGDGSYLGTLPPDFPFPVAWLDADRLVDLRRDALDRIYLVVHRVIRD